MRTISTSLTLSFALIAMIVSGCSNDNSTGPETAGPPNTMDSHDDHAGHAHPSEGPHHGDLIELGNEEYHAEILHDEG